MWAFLINPQCQQIAIGRLWTDLWIWGKCTITSWKMDLKMIAALLSIRSQMVNVPSVITVFVFHSLILPKALQQLPFWTNSERLLHSQPLCPLLYCRWLPRLLQPLLFSPIWKLAGSTEIPCGFLFKFQSHCCTLPFPSTDVNQIQYEWKMLV